MPCFSPLTGYFGKEINPATKKRGIVFSLSAAHSGIPVRLPCGQCIGCRLEKSRQWAMRCVHEAHLHKENVFVTLTYDDKHLPRGGSLVKEHLQKFMKRLRFHADKYGNKRVRFYACGEYGETTFRPHYHAILFGTDFYDKKQYRPGDGDKQSALYTSKALEFLWPFGQNMIGDVTFDSAAYVARYVMKKQTGKALENGVYERFDIRTGEIYDCVPEFTVMSRRPGIGLEWFNKFGPHSYRHDAVIMNGMEVRPPRYYDTKYELLDSEGLAALKIKRRRKAIALGRKDSTPERRRVREIVAGAKLNLKRRDL